MPCAGVWTLAVPATEEDLPLGARLAPRTDQLPNFARCFRRILAISTNNQSGGGGGCFGFGPNARPVSRCGRSTLDVASCRAYSWSLTSLYGGAIRRGWKRATPASSASA